MAKRTRDRHGRALTSGTLVEVYAPNPRIGSPECYDRTRYVMVGVGIVKEIHPHDGTMTIRFADGRAPWSDVSPHDVCRYDGHVHRYWVDSRVSGQRSWMQHCEWQEHEDTDEPGVERSWVTTRQPDRLVEQLKSDPTVLAYGSAEEDESAD